MPINQLIEEILFNKAEKYKPDGSEIKAVIHQWIHAIHNNAELYGILDDQKNKKEIIEILQANALFDLKNGFCDEVKEEFKLEEQSEKKFTFIDLFAGIGGMRIGFESAGGVCVFTSEYEKNAQHTYEQNYGEYPFGDITKIPEKNIPSHNVLVAGFPCQPFSHAGKKLGIEDTRGTLFYEIARIMESKKPEVALLENVKGLISHDKGNTLRVILQVMTNLGYKCVVSEDVIRNSKDSVFQAETRKMVLRSIDFGVPQNRQRIYIVLWRNDITNPFQYPEPTNRDTQVKSVLEKDPDFKYTISKRLWDGHKRRKVQNKANGKGFGFGLVTPDSPYTNTISARYYKDGSEILIAQPGMNPRKLTPREAARLQGFPDTFIINKSDVQAYKQFGNSVSVPVIYELAKNISKVVGGSVC